jgi:bifunctional DNA-binding transcriptional regulator/antitoxin component of YhaV-PrlF toxin-antitoxin module
MWKTKLTDFVSNGTLQVVTTKNKQIKETASMSDLPEKQVKRLRALIQEAETNLAAAKELLISIVGDEEGVIHANAEEVAGKVIEGVFDGQTMVGPDGKSYPVPANYASKSKLVEGDILKLTIADDGSFIYKQIGPVARRQIIGTLQQHDGAYYVEAAGKEYRVLLASVTYFKARVGDQVSIVIPEDNRDAIWAAVEASL